MNAMDAKRNIELNFKRLNDEPYSLENVFRPADYDWPGDWEGRALLAFLCHYRIHAELVPHTVDLFNALPEKTNPYLYFGKPFDGVTVDEQQLSGHNWYLRALLMYYELLGDAKAMRYAESVVENLYLPIKEWYSRYPLDDRAETGDVSGSLTGSANGWKLSSDVGCAFMCVDGLSQYFRMTHDERVYGLLEKIIDTFVEVDLLKYKLQTHTTLTCLRGILTLYRTTKNRKYLEIVKNKFTFYREHGMTLTYENFNWFGREDTWTEPCAVVDSFILANELYRITDEKEYLTLARRIWFNGLQFCQRDNGGAGPNTCVTNTQRVLKIAMYEAPFCCTMRYAEGLLYYFYYEHNFDISENAEPVTDEHGRKFIDDVMIVRYKGEEMPIFSASILSRDEAENAEISILH
jgi:hypothetical protein